MKRYKKYRLAFDAIGLMGLLLLALYFWFGHPNPQWRVPLESAIYSPLGLSSDSQKVYSIKQIWSTGNNVPKPVLQRRELATGKLEAEYPLQIPADDLSLLKPDPSGTPSFNYQVPLVKDYILLVATSLGIRIYDIQSGECLSRKNMPVEWIFYMLKNPSDQHHWGMEYSIYGSGNANVYDLTTGELLHTFERNSNQTFHKSIVSSDQKYLSLLWEKKKDEETMPSYELEILEIGTWKSLLRQATGNPGEFVHEGHLLRPDLFIQSSLFNDSTNKLMNRLECFRLDLSNGTLEPDKSHAFNGLVSKHWIFVRNEFLIQYGIRGTNQPILPKWKTLWNYAENLVRHGKFPEPVGQQDYRVYDFETGRLLRQLTGLTAFGHNDIFLSHDARFLLGVEDVGDWNDLRPFLSLFEIPSVWWERSWSASFYLSLILIFLWPVRFLGRKSV